MSGKVIGMLGAAGSGKDTAANFLREELKGNATTLAFADPLKEFAFYVFEFPSDNIWGSSPLRNENFADYAHVPAWASAAVRLVKFVSAWAKDVLGTYEGSELHTKLVEKVKLWFVELRTESLGKGLTPRRMLQTLGTECGRAVDADIWANCGLRRADAELRRGVRAVIITDCRFINEGRLVNAAGGELWLMDRPGAGLQGAAGQHASEQDMRSPEMQRYVTRTFRNEGSLDDLRKMLAVAVRETLGPDFEPGVES